MTEETLDTIGSSFVSHKSLKKLDLSNNKMRNFNCVLRILNGNKTLKSINIRGSNMSIEQLGFVWLGIR